MISGLLNYEDAIGFENYSNQDWTELENKANVIPLLYRVFF